MEPRLQDLVGPCGERADRVADLGTQSHLLVGQMVEGDVRIGIDPHHPGGRAPAAVDDRIVVGPAHASATCAADADRRPAVRTNAGVDAPHVLNVGRHLRVDARAIPVAVDPSAVRTLNIDVLDRR